MYLRGQKLTEKKRIKIALTKIYGFEKKKSDLVCRSLGFNQKIRILSLTKNQKRRLSRFFKKANFLMTSNLIRHLTNRRDNLLNIKCYRGLRKQNRYPVRGQRTQTNAKTARKMNY
jgi:small subunit ribosomal protein S13